MAWHYRLVSLKFQLGDKTLFASRLGLQVADCAFIDGADPVADPAPPEDRLEAGSEGFLIRSLPVSCALPALQKKNNFYRYISSQYQRYFIDLRQSFAGYKQQFSAKTRSTINRKVSKYAAHCGGKLVWKVYKTQEEAPEFFLLARAISVKTYQERLLGAGLPDTDEFRADLLILAREGRLRAFILFDGDLPVSYLYCPARDGVLTYQYLGYDPAYLKHSVGTVLQWLALEHLFGETCFDLFDFTEGQSDHKRLFATHSIRCANIFFLRASLRNFILLQSHRNTDRLSRRIGDTLERMGWKAKIKKLIRFAR